MYIGEGATMASEAAILGTPSVYLNELKLGYLEELSIEYKIVFLPKKYSEIFMEALTYKATAKKNTDVLLHMMGFLKKLLSKEEKQDILNVIEDKVAIFKKEISTDLKTLIDRDKLPNWKVRNSNSYYLKSLLKNLPFDFVEKKILRDNDLNKFQNEIKKNLKSRNDLILTSGAVSAGKFDFVPMIIKKFKLKYSFKGAYIRPGKPLMFAKFIKNKAFFGLPGNPISSAACFRFFVLPFLFFSTEVNENKPINAKLKTQFKKKKNFTRFIKGKLIFSKLISSPKALGVEILLGLRLGLALGFILAFGLTAVFVFFLGVTLILRPLGRGALSMISSILIISIPGMLILINFNNLHRENGHKSEV